MAILVDSSVLIDVVGAPGPWVEWSEAALRAAAQEDVLVISPVIYSEVSMGFDSIEALDAALPAALYRRDPIPLPAAFLAGRCSWTTGVAVGATSGFCPTSSSGHTRRSRATGC